MTLGIIFFILGLAATAGIAVRNSTIAAPLLVGFLARGMFAFADHLVLGLSRTADGAGWDIHSRLWAERGLGEILSHVEPGHHLYKVFMALLYYVFGHSTLMVQMVNAFLGTLVILVIWRLALLLVGSKKACLRAVWLVALFPSAVLHSGILLREAAITLPLTLGIYHLAAWHTTRRVRHAVLAGVSLLASMAFHSGAFAVFVALFAWVAGSWLRASVTGKVRLLGRNTVALLLMGGAILLVSGSGWGMSKFDRVEVDDLSTLSSVPTGRAAYLGDMRAETPLDLVLQAPLRVAYFLFAPFPWMLSSMRDVIGVVDALFFLWLVGRLVRGRRILRRNPTAVLVTAVFGALAVTFALGVSNYGTAFRHRSKMVPILIAVAAVVPSGRSKTRRNWRPRVADAPLERWHAPRAIAGEQGRGENQPIASHGEAPCK